jgi:hypothetical protein
MGYHFLQQYHDPVDSVQFVVALVWFDDGKPKIEWIEQAFDSTF